jgi:hypothetical protein
MLKLLTLSQRLQQVADLISPTSTSINICVDGVDIYSAKCSVTRVYPSNCYNFEINGDYTLNFIGGNDYYQITTVPTTSFELDRIIQAIETALQINGSTCYGIGSTRYKFVQDKQWYETKLIN